MTPEFKAKWIAALRSREYKQARSALKTDEGFCCVGVACDLIDPKGWGSKREITSASGVIFGYDWQDTPSTHIAGYKLENGIGLGSFALHHLAKMNDGNGMRVHTFAEIADYIEGISCEV